MAELSAASIDRKGLDRWMLVWAGVLLFSAATIFLKGQMPQLVNPPGLLNQPIVDGTNAVMNWFVAAFQWFFRALNWVLEWPMNWVNGLFQWLPWSATAAFFTVLAYFAGGRGLAIFTAFAMLYMAVTGYWTESMNTMSLVVVSVPLAVTVGFALGVWGYRSERAKKFIDPVLDLMQTVPVFAYLIPILLLFGFGPVVGLISSAIYACPPMVRNVMHGLRRVPPEVIESGVMSGTTPRQRFWTVEVPTALPQIMVGVNQTTMAALSMVIIAAIIGGFDDIGWEVLSTMRKAQFGQSVIAGAVIALIAMIMDRISWGFTKREVFMHTGEESFAERHRMEICVVLALLIFVVLAQIFPMLDTFPEEWRIYPAAPINDALESFVIANAALLDSIKNGFTFFVLLPLKIGLVKAISPFSWGFTFTPFLKNLYWATIAVLAIVTFLRGNWQGTVGVLIAGTVLFFGLAGLPWPAFIAVVTLTALQIGGLGIACFALLGMLFILVTGMWAPAMLSVYLCGAAVLFCALAGGAIGVWAARNSTVSRIVRPINDTLQTMPQFVYLIPVLMVFKVGEFSALIAVIAYAIVPMIRYTEQGIRNIRSDVIEASTSIGCTKREILFRVQLPMALPEIMLGINQTIMYGLAMLVIAALVGTRGLGQQVYLALGEADTGKGLVAGLGIALIAMVTDRIIQAWANRKKEKLGMS